MLLLRKIVLQINLSIITSFKLKLLIFFQLSMIISMFSLLLICTTTFCCSVFLFIIFLFIVFLLFFFFLFIHVFSCYFFLLDGLFCGIYVLKSLFSYIFCSFRMAFCTLCCRKLCAECNNSSFFFNSMV